jgi:hypothetical protein
LNWVFPVAFYKAFGFHVWGIRIWMLILKLTTVGVAYGLVRALASDPSPKADRASRTRGSRYAAYAYVVTLVLLGAQWQSLQIAYAFITVMPLTLGTWYFLLAAPFRDPRKNVLAAAILTACTIWTKLNTGMYLLSGGLFTYFFWTPVALPGKFGEDRGLFAHPDAKAWFGRARLLGALAYAVLFGFSIRQHFNRWFFLYLVVPLTIGLVWSALVTRPKRAPATPIAAHLWPFLLYLAVAVSISLAVLFGYYGSSAFEYVRELAKLLSLIKYTAPFPELGMPGGYIGLNEYYWLQLPWLFTLLFVIWIPMAHRFGARAYGDEWPRKRAQASALFILMTLHTFVMYARSDETHIYQALVLDVPAIFIVLAQIDAFIGAHRPTSTFALRLSIVGFGYFYILSLLVIPDARSYRFDRGDWANPALTNLRYRRKNSPYVRDLSADIYDNEWDAVEDAAAQYVKHQSVQDEEVLLLTANRLLYFNSGTRPPGGRYHFFFYLACVGLLDREGFDQLVPPGLIEDIVRRPPRIIVSSMGKVPLGLVFPEFVGLREGWYQQTVHFRHILIYELRINGEPVLDPLR